jgi:peptide/nickel transport system permease protein
MRSASQGNRVIQYLLVLVIAVTVNFALPRMMPGNPLNLIVGEDVGALSEDQRAEILQEYGLDKPVWQQYFAYWGRLLRLDFGYSYRQKAPIMEMIAQRLPWTLLIAFSSIAISTVLGVALGAISAWRRTSPLDIAMLWGMIMLGAMPAFWFGMLLVSVVAVNLGWLPTSGTQTLAVQMSQGEKLLDIAEHAILPVITLSVLSIPNVYMTMRYTMLGVLGSDFIRTARAKGVRERAVLFRHVVRNSLAPVATVLALRVGFAFGGTVVVETVFSYKGIGRMIFVAVSGRDYPVMQAAFLIFTIAVLLSNLAADLIYPLLDPRARGNR